MTINMLPKLGMEAAVKAIEEWGQPKSAITHLVFNSFSGVDMPGADLKLLKILGLRPSVNRVMIYGLSCYAGGTVLRIAKDIAENNPAARVLAICVETTTPTFQAPTEDDPVYLVSNAIFTDGVAAMIIGAAWPHESTERPIFQIISASQSAVPDFDCMIEGHYREVGVTMQISEKVPELIAADLEGNLVVAFGSIKVADWNSIFWAPHAGGRRILDCIEATFGLGKEKLRATRHVMEEFGNMFSVCVIFILDEIRKKSIEEGKATTGEGMELGVLVGFAPPVSPSRPSFYGVCPPLTGEIERSIRLREQLCVLNLDLKCHYNNNDNNSVMDSVDVCLNMNHLLLVASFYELSL